ncbi:MAG TPA: ISL3 family transposase [Nannocystis exedens]|nr:ISL3 family transposase [Nannocystis exedens]
MQLKTLLNFVEKHKGFVYDRFELDRDAKQPQLRITIRAAKRSRPRCSRCLRRSPTYDTLAVRTWRMVPLWGIAVFFLYAMRRVSCASCEAVVVEAVPWSEGKQRITKSFAWYLAAWAKRMSWQEVGRAFHVSWDTVFNAVRMAVGYGLEHRVVDDVQTIGVDEVMWHRRGRQFLTVVYALDEGRRRLLWIGRGRSEATLDDFFDWYGDAASRLKAVASDMWRAYLNVIRRRAPRALNILDRFHIVANVHKAVDQVRALEARELHAQGLQTLKHTRWLFLKSPENLSGSQAASLRELVKINLKTLRAYLLKEDLRQLWSHASAVQGCLFLTDWCRRAKASRLAPMARVARSLDKHSELILNWFFTGGAVSSGAVEGLNNKLKVITRRSYGFRSYDVTTTALYHAMGNLPEPEHVHRFA